MRRKDAASDSSSPAPSFTCSFCSTHARTLPLPLYLDREITVLNSQVFLVHQSQTDDDESIDVDASESLPFDSLC